MIEFGSLFSGFGGLDLGLERAGLKCAWQVENNPYAIKILGKHWPDVPKWADIESFPGWPAGLIVGGDPCQANSAAVGDGTSAHASYGSEFLRVVAAVRPRLVLRENPSHVRKDAPWPWWRFRSELESLGYAVLPFRLRACCLGAWHQRERMFLLAERTDANCIGLAGRQEEAQEGHASQLAGRVHAEDWFSVYGPRGFGSRAGLPDYVERMKGLGNAVHVDVAEFIGRLLITSLKHRP